MTDTIIYLPIIVPILTAIIYAFRLYTEKKEWHNTLAFGLNISILIYFSYYLPLAHSYINAITVLLVSFSLFLIYKNKK